MKVILTLCALVAAALADPIRVDTSLKVVNGNNAARNQFPYQVSLQRLVQTSFSHICGGSIISPRWVLTAAQCTDHSDYTYRVVAGILLLNETGIDGQQTINVTQIVIHPQYPRRDEGGPYDISLVRLATNLVYSFNVQAIALPPRGHMPSGEVNLTGWGLTQAGGSIANNLQYVQVPILSTEECRAQFENTGIVVSLQYNVCTGIKNGGESACNGDAGSPIVQNGVLAGIVTAEVSNCGATNGPTVYVNPSAYTDWIGYWSGVRPVSF